jgi:hypothetical protein
MISKILPRKLNSSQDSRLSDATDMRDAVNVTSSEDYRDGGDGGTGNGGVLKPVKSNAELTNTVFTDGNTLRVIGKAICDKHNVIYFFVVDETTAANSGVYAYDPDLYFSGDGRDEDDIVAIYTSASFGFQSNYFVKADLTYVQKKFQSGDSPNYESTPILFFTDNNNEPRKLNVLRAYWGDASYADGSDAKVDFITACPVTPTMPPTASFSGSGNSTNEFINVNGFQFAYQLIYKDGNESAISTYSDIVVPDEYVNQGVKPSVNVTAFDTCNVAIPGDHINAEVGTVRILARRGNDGAWQNIHEQDSPNANGFTYAFKNDTVDTSVATEDVAKQFTNLPKKAYTQTIIGDRVMYGNYVEGFDKVNASATITAVSQERPADNLSYDIKVEPATCLGELDEYLRWQVERFSEVVDYDDVKRVFNYDKSVNKNTAFRINVSQDALPESIPVNRTVSLSFSFKPQSNFHLYQARNGNGYHGDTQLGGFYGPLYPPADTTQEEANFNKVRFNMTREQAGYYADESNRRPIHAASASNNVNGGYIHPLDPFGAALATDLEPIPSATSTPYRQLTPRGFGQVVWNYEVGDTPAYDAVSYGTSAFTPLVIPMDGEANINVSMSMTINDISSSYPEADDIPTEVNRADIALAIANYLSTGSVGTFTIGNTSYTADELFTPADNDNVDENGWFFNLSISRGLSNGDRFSSTSSFAKTITLAGKKAVGVNDPLGSASQDISASSAFTLNAASVKFRLFKDNSYKRAERPVNSNLDPGDPDYRTLSGEGYSNDDQRVGLYVDSITDASWMTCIKLPTADAKWQVFTYPQWNVSNLIHNGDPNREIGYHKCDPTLFLGSTSNQDETLPMSHCRGRLGGGSAASFFSGTYEPSAINSEARIPQATIDALQAAGVTPEDAGAMSAFTLVDGAGFGASMVGSIEDSTNNHDTFPLILDYFGEVDESYTEIAGGFNLGTCPTVTTAQGGAVGAPFDEDGDYRKGGSHSPLLSNEINTNNLSGTWWRLIGLVAGDLGQNEAFYVFPTMGITDPDEDSLWPQFSKLGLAATDYWFGRKLTSAEVTEFSSSVGFDDNLGRRSFKTSANHGFGVIYYDHRGRANSVGKIGTMYSPPYHTRGEGSDYMGAVEARITLANAAPSWAEYFQIVYTGNTTYSDFIQYTAGGAFALAGETGDESNNIYVSLNYLQDNIDVSYAGQYGARSVDGSDQLYTPIPGDILRVISYYNAEGVRTFPQSDYSFEVVDYRKLNRSEDNPFFNQDSTIDDGVHGAQTGAFVIIRDNPDADGFSYLSVLEGGNAAETPSHLWNNRTVIEICRPTDAQAEENQVFYESSKVLPIAQHSNTITFDKGDVWFRKVPTNLSRNQSGVYLSLVDEDGGGTPNLRDYFLESKTFNDKVRRSDVWGKGKIKIQNPDEHEVRREASITFSDKNNPASKFLRLTSFSPAQLQFKDLPLEHGAINYLANQQDSVLSIQENKTASVPYNRNIISTAAGQDSLIASASVLGTAVFYTGKFGCDNNPESVCEVDGSVYFASKSNGEVYRFDPSGGVAVISDAGMKKFFRDMFKEAMADVSTYGDVKVVGGYDPLRKEFILSVYNEDDTA